jgi:hypothetical protein
MKIEEPSLTSHMENTQQINAPFSFDPAFLCLIGFQIQIQLKVHKINTKNDERNLRLHHVISFWREQYD